MSVSSNLQSKPSWLDTFPDADVAFGFDSTGMWFSGDASDAPYPIRTNYDIDGETTVVVTYTFVHADVDEGCPDQGICFFKADTDPYWVWGSNTSRIAVQYDCGGPEINGQENTAGSEYELTVGDTYTARVTYNPVAETVTHELFEGSSASGSPVDTFTLTNERLSAGAYRIGFHADLDTETSEKAYFTYLEISEGPVEAVTRVFRALHFPNRRREVVSEVDPTPINVQPGEMLYDAEENKLYAGLEDTSTVEISSGGGGGASYDQSLNTTDGVTFNALTLAGAAVVVSGITDQGEGYIAGIMGWGDPEGTKWSDLNGTYVKTAVAVRPAAYGNGQQGMHTPEAGTFNYYLANPVAMGYPNPGWNGIAYFLAPGNRSGWGADPDNDASTDPPVNYWRLVVGADWPYTYFTNPSTDATTFPLSGWVPVSAEAPTPNEGAGGNGAEYLPNYDGGFAVAEAGGSGLTFVNGTQVTVGTFDIGLGGNFGVSLVCTVGFQLNWQAGHLRNVYINDTTGTPQTIYVDSPMEFAGESADTLRISDAGITFPDGTVKSTAGPKRVALTYASTINTDASTGEIFDVTLTGAATLAAPTNPTSGQRCLWRIKRTNGQALTLNAIFHIINGETIDDTDNATTFLDATYDSAANRWDVILYSNKPPAVPGAPTELTAELGTNTEEVDLTWAAPTFTGNPALTDYVVQYSDDDGESWTTFSDGTGTETTTTVTGLTNDTAYIFQVAAVNSIGQSDYSAASSSVTPTSMAQPLPSLLLHFDGANEDTTTTDSSLNELTVTSVDNAQISTVQSKFGGSSGYLNNSRFVAADADGPPVDALSFGTGPFTIDFWVYITGGASFKCMVELGTSGSYPEDRLAIHVYSNGQLTVENTGAGNLPSDPAQFTLNEWVHVAVTRDESNVIRLFKNGVVVGTPVTTAQSFTANVVHIGRQWDNTAYMVGYIDELRIVKGAADYTANFTPPTQPYADPPPPPPPPSLLLHMDGANESTTFTDSSSNNWTVTPSGAAAISTTQSKFGGASGYFSSASVLTIPDHPSLEFGSADFTIEFWIYRVGASGFIAGKGDAATAAGSSFALAFNVGGPSSFYFDSTSSVGVDGMDDLSADQWQHVAFVRTAGDIVLYIDGLEVSRETIGSGVINDTAQPLKIGNYVGGSLECFIDELRIIKGYAAYTANFTPSTQPFADPPPPLPSLLLHMDGANESTTFTDSSSNNWTVTPSGGAAISTAQSKFGGASMYLDGTGAAVTASASIMDFGAGDFTVECWLYLLAEQYHGVVGSGATGGCVIGVADDGSVLCDYRGAGTGVTSSAGAVSVNSWQHLAVTRSSGAVKIFVNGIAVATGTMSAAFSAAAITSVGNWHEWPVWLLNGYMDELRIIKGYAAYTANFTPSTQPFADPPPPLPSLLLHMDGPSAVTDSSPNALTFTTPPGSFNTTTKKFGNASYSVDSLQGLATTTRGIPSLVGVNWTVEAWVYRLSGDATYACVVSLNGAADNSEFAGGLHLGVNANGSGYCNDGGSAAASSSAGAVPVGQWVHIAAVRSGGTTTLYFNGVADGTTSQEVVAGPYFANVGAVPGAPYSAFSSDILIDELRIIKGYAAYTTNFTPPTAPHGS